VQDPSDREDIAKIEDFLDGDPRAFEFLFDKYRDRVYRTAYRFVRLKEDALEITQDVFLRVFQGLKDFKTDSKFYTWLYRVTVNRSIDFLRSRKGKAREVDTEILESEGRTTPERSVEPSPADIAQEHELEQKVQEAMASLSEKHRAVFLLHAMENLSYKEIAQVVGTSIGTVMSRLFYARKKLQEILGTMGVDRPNMEGP
jgi:RNA polymerase sigma-70 factor (ECF subfamily)